mmetsp:Transcript_26524/g.23512  ORF Transcript_26524/g.23512 Transcript_26524/m.23512 type:complete len:207 (-) Transcript_26524:1975-2595(-)
MGPSDLGDGITGLLAELVNDALGELDILKAEESFDLVLVEFVLTKHNLISRDGLALGEEIDSIVSRFLFRVLEFGRINFGAVPDGVVLVGRGCGFATSKLILLSLALAELLDLIDFDMSLKFGTVLDSNTKVFVMKGLVADSLCTDMDQIAIEVGINVNSISVLADLVSIFDNSLGLYSSSLVEPEAWEGKKDQNEANNSSGDRLG